jgi:serine/threonine protein kinase
MEDGSNQSSSGPPEPSAYIERQDARIGTVVGKYRIIRLLGRGGMGSVYEAQHIVLGRRFAVKFLLPEFAANRDVLRRFENEAKAAGRLEHPNIEAVTDLGRAPDDSPFLVMEYLTGQELRSTALEGRRTACIARRRYRLPGQRGPKCGS